MQRNEPSPRRASLEPVFEENRSPAKPLHSGASQALPPPFSHVEIPLTRRSNPPRVVIADDDLHALRAWERSARTVYEGAIDLRTWAPSNEAGHPGLLDQLRSWAGQGWRADIVVVDLNFDDGGKHGVHYVEELRREPGFLALPAVLATSNQFSDLEQGRLSTEHGPVRSNEVVLDWLRRLKPLEPEAILYGKTGDARFLGRVGQGLPDWKRAARRRAWARLLSEVAEQLDNVRIGVAEIARKIVQFAVAELGVAYAIVGQRGGDGGYSLVAQHPESDRIGSDDVLRVDQVPVLGELVKDGPAEPGGSRTPLLRRIGRADAGPYADDLENLQLLGAPAVLGNRSVGFIALMRLAGAPEFEREVDARHLGILVRLLASAIRVDLLRERQTRLLTFANLTSTAQWRREVSQQLAEILHDEVHHGDDRATVTVRLIHYGNARLEARAQRGAPGKAADLPVGAGADSVAAEVAFHNRARRISDTRRMPGLVAGTEAGDPAGAIDGQSPMLSQLCAPLNVGGFALGVVDLEHPEADFYRSSDESFVSAAAALAARALERIRSVRLLRDMADFVLLFAHKDTETLDARLRDLLFMFCGYSALVELQAGESDSEPWRVTRLHLPTGHGDERLLCREIERVYATEWPQTLMGRLVAQRHWEQAVVKLEKDDFRAIALGVDPNQKQTADAVLWLRHDDAPPHRAMLLMWGLPPPLGDHDVDLLATMARVFSELDSRKASIQALVEKNLVGEQAARIGHVMQHFKHRMRNLTGSQTVHLDGLEDAFDDGDREAFATVLQRARGNARDLADAFQKSHGFIKVPQFADFALHEVVAAASADLADRLRETALAVDVPRELAAHTDLDIASLALYSLIENALDATTEVADPQIRISGAAAPDGKVCLSVCDNGHGISAEMRERLFGWGQTTKRAGLGSALAFARERTRALGGQLDLAVPQPAQGACFELRLPAARGADGGRP